MCALLRERRYPGSLWKRLRVRSPHSSDLKHLAFVAAIFLRNEGMDLRYPLSLALGANSASCKSLSALKYVEQAIDEAVVHTRCSYEQTSRHQEDLSFVFDMKLVLPRSRRTQMNIPCASRVLVTRGCRTEGHGAALMKHVSTG